VKPVELELTRSFFDPPPPTDGDKEAPAKAAGTFIQGRHRYQLRADVPRRFKTHVVSPDNEATEEDCANKFMISSDELIRAIAAKLTVERRTLEVFTRQIEMDLTNATMDPDQAARAAIKVLQKNESFDPRELRRALLRKLTATVTELGLPGADNPESVSHMLNVILCGNPQLLHDAQKEALSAHCLVEDSDEELPAHLDSEAPLPTARLNVYGVFPPGLNAWETDFAGLLDRDQLNMVAWWHRNLPHKPWSVQVVLSDGRAFFPDFIIGIDARKKWDGMLLADPKYYFESTDELPKIHASHPVYGRVLILSKQAAQWTVVRYDEAKNRAVPDRPFRVADLAGY
jgi:type III restriction enzyme